MRIDIGMKVWTVEGEEVGKVERVILHPETRVVDAVVVHRGLVLTRDVVVPFSLIQDAGKDGVRLRIGKVQLAELPDFVERHYVAPSEEAAITSAYAPGSILYPLAPRYDVPGIPTLHETVAEERIAPPPDVDISAGTEVRTVDGPIGVVDEVRTDPISDRVTTIVVRKGPDLKKDVEIPIEFVDDLADDHIKLSLTTRQVEDLPQPVTDRYLTAGRRRRSRSRRGRS